jgi:hypothetical protein
MNLNEIWQSQTAVQPTSADLLEKVGAIKTANYRRLIFTTLAFALTSTFICWIWATYNPQLFTTKLGIILTVLSMAIYGYSMNQQYPLLKKINNASSNLEYLEHLLTLKKKQVFLQTTLLNLYFVLLSVGIGLYMIEPVQKMTIFWGVVAYTIASLWVIFSYFYLRPKQIKKEQASINELILNFERICKQMK